MTTFLTYRYCEDSSASFLGLEAIWFRKVSGGSEADGGTCLVLNGDGAILVFVPLNFKSTGDLMLVGEKVLLKSNG